jgi:hypothetical protein
MTIRNLASKLSATAAAFNNAAPYTVSRSSRIHALAGSACDSNVRLLSSMRPMSRSPSSSELHGTDSLELEERIRPQVLMCPKRSRRVYGTVSSPLMSSTSSSLSSLDDAEYTRTWNAPVRHAPQDSLREDDYDQWTVMAGYIPNGKDIESVSPNMVGDYVSPFDRSSAEQVMTMMDTSYYYASHRARNHASSSSAEEQGKH